MQFNKAIPEFSVTGLIGTYIAWVSMTGADVPVEPFWLVAIAVALFFALGLWRAYANDGKITPEGDSSAVRAFQSGVRDGLGRSQEATSRTREARRRRCPR